MYFHSSSIRYSRCSKVFTSLLLPFRLSSLRPLTNTPVPSPLHPIWPVSLVIGFLSVFWCDFIFPFSLPVTSLPPVPHLAITPLPDLDFPIGLWAVFFPPLVLFALCAKRQDVVTP